MSKIYITHTLATKAMSIKTAGHVLKISIPYGYVGGNINI